MKLIAFDLFSMVVSEGDKTLLHTTKGNQPSRELSEYAVSRLGAIGFKVVDLEVASLDHAWEIVKIDGLKNLRVAM